MSLKDHSKEGIMSSDNCFLCIKNYIEQDFNINLNEIACIHQNNGTIIIDFYELKNSDYYFSVWFFEDGDIHLCTNKGNYDLWYRPYEKIDNYKISCIYKVLKLLLVKKSMIKVNKGFLLVSIELCYFDLNKWKSLGSSTFFRFGGFNFPRNKVTYYSSPLL